MSADTFSDHQLTKVSEDFTESHPEKTPPSNQMPLKRMPTFEEYQAYQAALAKVEASCSLKVGYQMETKRESGKKLIKEKAFHVIYEVNSKHSASAKNN